MDHSDDSAEDESIYEVVDLAEEEGEVLEGEQYGEEEGGQIYYEDLVDREPQDEEEVDLDEIENEIYGRSHNIAEQEEVFISDEEEEGGVMGGGEMRARQRVMMMGNEDLEVTENYGQDVQYVAETGEEESMSNIIEEDIQQQEEYANGQYVEEDEEEYREEEGGVDVYYEDLVESGATSPQEEEEVDVPADEPQGTMYPGIASYNFPQNIVYRLPQEKRSKMDTRHPKFSGYNNMQIVQRMVNKGKVVNPTEDDEEEYMYFNREEEYALAKRGIRILGSKRNLDQRNGNDVIMTKKSVKFLYLGGGVPLEPVLAHPRLNKIVENFRKELSLRKKRFGNNIKYKVDPSSIVPASVSGSAGSSSIGSEETDPECLATDDESESEIINGSIAAWLVPENGGSRSPTPEFELEEPEFILTTAGSHSMEPPTKKRKQKHEPQPHTDGRIYPKPGFSYSCLIAMSLKNSKTGCLPVSEIYKFMCDHFPYFKTAPSGWKNSVRHNLSLNKCFEKIEKPGNGARKGCLWALNPAKIHKMDEEVQKWSRKDPLSIRRAMSDPENLEMLERGELKKDYSGNGSDEDEEEEYGESSNNNIISHAQRPADQKIHLKKEDPLDFGTITNVQGNYICAQGPQTYTLSFSNLATTTPIIIRRTPVK